MNNISAVDKPCYRQWEQGQSGVDFQRAYVIIRNQILGHLKMITILDRNVVEIKTPVQNSIYCLLFIRVTKL